MKSDRKEISYDTLYMWNLKRNDTNELTKQKQTHRFMAAGGKDRRKRYVAEFEMGMYTLLYLKWMTNKELLYSPWNSAQCYVAAWM